jgi:hypothetical protein
MRFHLSTAFLVMLTADIFVWLNIAWKGFPLSSNDFPQPHSDFPIYLANGFLFAVTVVPLFIFFEVVYHLLKQAKND